MTTEQQTAVTQADREAAARMIEAYWLDADASMLKLAASIRAGHSQGVFVRAFRDHRLASQADQGRDMFEAGYMAMWSEAHVKGAIKLPKLSDAALDRAWDIYLATREDAATHPQPSQKGEGA